jgi:hypothetical protein
MMAFRVGQKVVRVLCGPTTVGAWIAKYGPISYPDVGDVVTIRAIFVFPSSGETVLLFIEHDNSGNTEMVRDCGGHEPGFPAYYFRPVVERKTDISIFTAMLTDTRQPVSQDQE